MNNVDRHKSTLKRRNEMGNENNISYVLTQCGRKNVEDYIRELEAKRKEIMDAGKDTCDSTNIPTVEDIQNDIAFTGVNWDDPDGPCYYNGWGVTDNYESDYPLLLKFGRDFAESGYIPSDTDTIVCPEQYSAGGHKDMVPNTTVFEQLPQKDLKYAKYATEMPIWHSYGDGSGRFVGVTGKTFYEYDLDTDEIKYNGRWHYIIGRTIDGKAWRDYYADLYKSEYMHDDLVAADFESHGLEYAKTNHDVRLSNDKALYIALDEDTMVDTAVFADTLAACQKAENQNYSSSTLHCDKLAEMILCAIRESQTDATGHQYVFNFENKSFSIPASSVRDVSEIRENSQTDTINEARTCIDYDEV